MTIKVLLADDHQLIRGALADLFAETDDIVVVGECSDGCQVGAAVGRTGPDVVLMDLRMPVMDGLTAARELRVTHPDVHVVVLTGGLTRATVLEARAAGVAGYLLKGDDPGALVDRVRTVAAGGAAWSTAAAEFLGPDWESFATPALTGATSPYVVESPERHR